MISLIGAIRQAGAIVEDVICVVEKVGDEGACRVYEATDIQVKAILKIVVNESSVEVL